MSKGLVCGVGVCDSGNYKASEGGVATLEYISWRNMIYRCYSEKYQSTRPTYIGCSVCDEWLSFQNFAKWFATNSPNDNKKYHIDKDLKVTNNRVYSPECCIFVPPKVNSFILDGGLKSTGALVGVDWRGSIDRFRARCGNPITGKKEHIGYFDSEINAHLAWRKRKSELAYELAMAQDRDEVKQALLNWKDALDSNKIHPY